MCDTANFLLFCHKVKERLIITLDEKIGRGEPLNDADEYFLKEMFRQYKLNDNLELYCKPDFCEEDVTEQELFT
jgi:hypothetical protein